MKAIDRYVQHLLRMDAAALILQSNATVTARMANGSEKTSAQIVEHAHLVAAVQEIAPPDALTLLRSSRPARFRYPVDAPTIAIDVVPTPGAWRVLIVPHDKNAPGDRFPVVNPPAPTRAAGSASSIAPSAASAPLGAPSVAPTFSVAASIVPTAAPTSSVAPVAFALSAAAAPADTAPIDRFLRAMASVGASDLHLSSGRVPMMRLHGEIHALSPDVAELSPEALRALIVPTMPALNRNEYAARNDTDYAYELQGAGRFRANAFVDRRGPGAVFRRIPFEIVPAEELGLSRHVMELCNLSKGLVLVTGPTGSGKSTTLAAMIDRINATRKDHIITIEDPIEFVHRNRKCLVNQREVRVHTDGFKDALRAALREDPDIVLVGEMRDLETVAIAIETAETGHLVFGTLHTRTAPSTVDRVIDQFPAERQAQIRAMLSESLKGVISQTLCKRITGGRVAAYEVLIATPAVSNLIREGKTYQLPGVMQTQRSVGMVTLNDALIDLVRLGRIDAREAWFRSVARGEMRNVMNQAGVSLPPGARTD